MALLRRSMKKKLIFLCLTILLKKFTHYSCQKDENKFASLFANDGVYHDYIYGTFIGKQNIKIMINNFFYRDAKNFYWEMYDHVYKDNN